MCVTRCLSATSYFVHFKDRLCYGNYRLGFFMTIAKMCELETENMSRQRNESEHNVQVMTVESESG